MGKEIEQVADRQVMGFIDMAAAEKALTYAKWAVTNGVAPKGMTGPQYFMCIQAGADLGMQLMQINSSLCIINGRVSIYGPEVIARAKRAGYKVSILDKTATSCTCEISTPTDSYKETFTMEDAKTAGLTEGDRAAVWKKYPKDMLMWKVVARCVRVFAPEVLGGNDFAEDVVELKQPQRIRTTITRPDVSQIPGAIPAEETDHKWRPQVTLPLATEEPGFETKVEVHTAEVKLREEQAEIPE